MTPTEEQTSMLQLIRDSLPRYQYRFSSEVSLHESIAEALLRCSVEFAREVVAGQTDRFDFLVAHGVVIEVKTKGSLAEALRQCGRYAARGDVSGVILAATRHWALGNPTFAAHGKSIHVIKLNGASF